KAISNFRNMFESIDLVRYSCVTWCLASVLVCVLFDKFVRITVSIRRHVGQYDVISCYRFYVSFVAYFVQQQPCVSSLISQLASLPPVGYPDALDAARAINTASHNANESSVSL